MILESLITCPHCGTQKTEAMPTDACQFFYECTGCGVRLRPKPGDCCVFCSYGSVPCPPIQEARATGAASCCGPATQAPQAADWLASVRTSTIAWWLPKIAMLGALFAPVPVRATVWVAALGWMGTACILNSRRCGRTHCRYTGPYYLAMILPVIIAGIGIVPLSLYGWIALGIIALGGSGLIWFATERAWGKFRQPA